MTGKGLIRIEETLDLEMSADEAFEFLADFSNLPKWDPGIVASYPVAGFQGSKGPSYEVTVKFMGRESRMHYATTEHNREERTASLRGVADGIVATDRISVAERGTGSTITWQADFELSSVPVPLRPLTRPLFVRLGKKAMRGLQAYDRSRSGA